VQKQQQNAVWRGEKQREELKKLRQDEMLKHNEMQLKLKEDWRKNEKEKDLAEMKKVVARRVFVLNRVVHSVRNILT